MIIQFEPDLEQCVKTLAKREYDHIVKGLLASDRPDPQSEQKVSLLTDFMNNTDFNSLRSEYEPFLAQGRRIRFIVSSEGESGYYFEVL